MISELHLRAPSPLHHSSALPPIQLHLLAPAVCLLLAVGSLVIAIAFSVRTELARMTPADPFEVAVICPPEMPVQEFSVGIEAGTHHLCHH